MTDHRITVQIKISPETLALLEMSMTEGDTYDEVISRLMKTDYTITLPKGVSIIDPGAITKMEVIDRVAEGTRIRLANLAKAALAVRDDIAKSVDLPNLKTWWDENGPALTQPWATSAVMKTENVLELDRAVKAVFDE